MEVPRGTTTGVRGGIHPRRDNHRWQMDSQVFSSGRTVTVSEDRVLHDAGPAPLVGVEIFGDASLGLRLPLPDACVELRRGFLNSQQADWLFDRLRETVPWRQDKIRMFGKVHDVPRLQQWFSDDGLVYTWSGIRMEPASWLPALKRLRDKLIEETSYQFNTVLANLYRNGQDTVGWHADDEPELGKHPVIASVSLGAERDFQLRHRNRTDIATQTIGLTHGSLLLMSGTTQQCWKHCVPRRKRVEGERVNLTFRYVVPGPAAACVDGSGHGYG